MTQFKAGFQYLLGGFKLIGKAGIRLYVLIPLLINSLLFTAVIAYGANLINDLINYLVSQWAWLEWVKWLIWPLFVLVSLTIVFFCFSVVANLIGAPFNGFLSEAVERHLSETNEIDKPSKTLLEEITLAFKTEFQKFLYFAVRALPLLLLFVIPGIQLGAPMVWFLFSAWMLTLEYTEYPMSNHGIHFSQQRRTLFANKQLAFGFGLAAMLLTLIPVINFFVMPVAVAGATRMYYEQNQLHGEDGGKS